MFSNSIDNKPVISYNNNNILNLAEPIFDNKKSVVPSYDIYKISADYVMRPDLVSIRTYNTDEYTEFILKLNGILNPFTLDDGDILIIPNMENVKNNLVKRNSQNYNGDAAIRNTYKYIDKAKIPTINKENIAFDNQTIGKNITPANIAPEGTPAIVNRNGRIYFGENSGILCAQNGIAAGDYLVAKISNKNKDTSIN